MSLPSRMNIKLLSVLDPTLRPLGKVQNLVLLCCGLFVAFKVFPPSWRWVTHFVHPRGFCSQILGSRDSAQRGVDGIDSSSANSPPDALYGLQILHDDPKATVDIVAVHGLGANPTYAWVWNPKHNPPGEKGYPDKKVNWLVDFLPQVIPQPYRVMTFNYNSTWIFGAPQQRLSTISDGLLTRLRNKREETGGRPLIFIGHSFGGNIIEQAIVSATRQGSENSDIAGSTVGVIFLGTPHRGSPAAKWGALIASNAWMLRAVAEKRILEDLEEQSGTLTDRLHVFSSWLFSNSVRVMCCFEKNVTDYSSRIGLLGNVFPSEWTKQLVVPESTACIDGHTRVGLDTDHFKINKFYGLHDPSFEPVHFEIARMTKGAEEMLKCRRNPQDIPTDDKATSGELRKCLQEMRVTNPRDILSDVQNKKGKKVEHTCEWILKLEEFSSWGANDTSQFLRLIGSPGIGKTTMSTFLVEVLKEKAEKSPGKAFAYFFCDDKDQSRKTPTAILRSLIWQLLLQRNELFHHIESDFERHKESRVFENLFENFPAVWRIFQDMLRDERRVGEVFILIDALDECERSTREALLQRLKELFQASPESGGKFKFLITCRPEISDIEDELYGVGVALRMDSTKVNADLSKYIDREAGELAKTKRYSQELEGDVKKALKSQATGTFLWASLMLKKLKSIPNSDVRDTLKYLPKGLDEIYSEILNRNIPEEGRERARFLLLSMVAARRPLKKKEIAASFALWKHNKVLTSQDLRDYMDIYSSCSSIIDQDAASDDNDTTINFCHQSVKDFLLDNRDGSSEAWYHTSLDVANALMFQMCWRYLSSKVFGYGSLVISRQDNVLHKANLWGLQSHTDQYSFLKYASSEWEDHAIASCPALLKEPEINVEEAPTLRDAWLLRTAREGQSQVLEVLLKKDADSEAKAEDDRTPLSWAAGNGHEDVVKLLLEKSADVDAKDTGGRTPLSLAAGNEHKDIVKLLLEKSADVDAKDTVYGQTPLSWAAENGHEDIVKLLLEKSANVDAKDTVYGRTPLSYATENGHENIVKLLLEKSADVDAKDTVYGQTPLSYAAENGHENIVKLLLEKSTDVDAKSKSNQTPLSWAAENGHENIVKLLLEKSTDVDAKDTIYGRTPLSYAAGNGHEDVVKLLLEKSADIDAKSKSGQTSLSYADKRGHENIVKLLRGYIN